MAASYGIALTSTLVTPSELALGLSDPSISSASISFPSSNPSFRNVRLSNRIAVVKAMSGSDNVDADLNAVKPSKTAAITDEATALARACVPVIKLAGGEPDLDKPAPIVEAFAMTGRQLGYIAVGPKHFIAACGKIQSQVEHLDGKMDLESVYEDQGFFSAAVQDNHSDNAIDSDDWQRAEPTLHRNFTVRPPDENQKDPPFTKASIEGEEDDGEGGNGQDQSWSRRSNVGAVHKALLWLLVYSMLQGLCESFKEMPLIFQGLKIIPPENKLLPSNANTTRYGGRYPFETQEGFVIRLATIGLKKADIQRIPTAIYGVGVADIRGTDCSICLEEFVEGRESRQVQLCIKVPPNNKRIYWGSD